MVESLLAMNSVMTGVPVITSRGSSGSNMRARRTRALRRLGKLVTDL
jgi:hypothetical protein